MPEGKIRSRHDRLWGLVAAAIARADAAIVYDSSRAAQPFRRIAHFEHGVVVGSPAGPDGRPRR